MNEIEIFCNNIRLLRRVYRLTQKDMAKVLGISVHSLAKLEQGILPPHISSEVLIYINYCFGITPDRMFTVLTEDDLEEMRRNPPQ